MIDHVHLLMLNLTNKKETTEQVDAPLREHAKKALKELANKKLLNFSKLKFNTFLDCIATNNVTNDNSCESRKRTQDDFASTGQISKRKMVKTLILL